MTLKRGAPGSFPWRGGGLTQLSPNTPVGCPPPTASGLRFQDLEAERRQGQKEAPRGGGRWAIQCLLLASWPPEPRVRWRTRIRVGMRARVLCVWFLAFSVDLSTLPTDQHLPSLPLNRNFNVIWVWDGFCRAPTIPASTPWLGEGPLWPRGNNLSLGKIFRAWLGVLRVTFLLF